MDITQRFSAKAKKYAKYRWGYAPQAIQTIVETTGLFADSVVADIGSGTGILTKHFVDKARYVFAVEPSPEMRQQAVKELARYSSFHSIEAQAQATTLPDQSIDLITVGQALHWFEPEATKREFLRILRPGGWLAILWNKGADPVLGEALQELFREENGWDTSPAVNQPAGAPPSFYYGEEDFLRLSFPQVEEASWENFIGALGSAAPAPDEEHPLYGNFEKGARRIFDRFSLDGRIRSTFSTELCLGQIKR
jgi:ubiquinone/menaquinone biosynthesis C-methylase UbiE